MGSSKPVSPEARVIIVAGRLTDCWRGGTETSSALAELFEAVRTLENKQHAPETLQPHQNLALARINHLARKGRFDEADAQLFRDAIVHRPGSVPHHHIWSVNGPPRDPDPEQVCDFGCGLKWKDRQEAEAHAQKAKLGASFPESTDG